MQSKFALKLLAAVLFLASAHRAFADGPFCYFDVGGRQSFAVIPDGTNPVLEVDVAACLGFPSGTPVVLNGVGWNLLLQAIGDSWLSDAQVHFTDAAGDGEDSVDINPAFFFQDPNGNEPTPFFIPVLKLDQLGQSPILLTQGTARLEFGESFDNAPGPDTNWLEGVLFVQAAPPCQRADTNCDTFVDYSDVEPFVAGLLDPSTLQLAAQPAADTNGDGLIDGADVQSFVECVIAGGC